MPSDHSAPKAAGRNPRELAEAIVAALEADLPTHVERVEIAGPGFVNFHLADTWLHELLTDARYIWHGPRNFVELDPRTAPAHVFRLRRRLKTEQEFEYYL